LKQVNDILQADITDRKRIEDELRRNQDIAERLAVEMEVIAEIGKVVSSTWTSRRFTRVSPPRSKN
jgi:hypothetical protein